jgi:hypothetical protein
VRSYEEFIGEVMLLDHLTFQLQKFTAWNAGNSRTQNTFVLRLW